MKKLLLCLPFCLYGFTLSAQSDIQVLTNRISVGEILQHKEKIYSDEIFLPDSIYNLYLDTSSNSWIVKLYKSSGGKFLFNSATLMYYDMGKERVVWAN